MSAYELSIIHMADQEAAMDALFDVPRASSVINALKDDYENTIILSAGDNYITGPFFKASVEEAMGDIIGASGVAGRSDILINNALGIQASVVGNHEFDAGPELFNQLLMAEGKYPGPNFPYLSANLDFSKTSLAAKIAPTTIIEINGKRIGIVGATTPTLPEISSIGDIQVVPVQSRDHRALASVIQKHVDALTAQGIEIIILLAHMQDLAIEEELAGYLSDVDVIIGGGSDSILLDENDRPRDGDGDLVYGEYPLWKTSLDGKLCAVLNTDGQYRYVGRFVAQFDDHGNLLKAYDSDVSGAFATDEAGVAALGDAPADPAITQIIGGLKSLILDKDQNILGVVPKYLDARKSVIRTEATNLGSLIAEANLWYARRISQEPVDAAIANAGGIRASIGVETVLPGETAVSFLPTAETSYKPAGGISQLDIEAAQAFNNELVLVTLTAEEIKATLEDGLKFLPNAHGGYPQVSGITLEIDPSKNPRIVNTETGAIEQVGQRVQGMKIGDATIIHEGKYVASPDAEFRIVTLKYLANGGNGYPIKNYVSESPQRVKYRMLSDFTEGESLSGFADIGTEQDALAEYLLSEFSGAESR
ncbi:MAG: bifunctional metallophosphatase/5'-nucleotidase [Opitutales bacterium]